MTAWDLARENLLAIIPTGTPPIYQNDRASGTSAEETLADRILRFEGFLKRRDAPVERVDCQNHLGLSESQVYRAARNSARIARVRDGHKTLFKYVR